MTEHSGIKKGFIALTLFLYILAGNLPSQTQKKKEPPFPFSEYQLSNGLKVIISEANSLPLVSVVVAYNVGSIYELPGKFGLAHLLERLMFQGSENVSPMQHISLIDKVGGSLNATTTEDKTIFQQTVSSNQLSRVLWLESDRMRSLQITQSNVEQVKVTILEDIRHRKATEPYRESLLLFDRLLYPETPPYIHPVIGQEADMRNITLEDVKKFYSDFYIPNNAVLSIAGNIDKKKTISEVRKYFETIPKGKEPPPIPVPEDSKKTPITVPITDPLAPSPGFHLGYEIAPPSSSDFYAMKIIEYILLQGKTSRLYNRLIKKNGTALYYIGGIEIKKDLARLKIFVVNNNEIMAGRSKRAIFSEINKLRSRQISARELMKAKNMFKMDYINQYTTSLGKARFLAETSLSKKSLGALSTELDKYLAVNPFSIIRVTNKYLIKGRIIVDIKIR
jgi:predicted Zn-dependent peptidase